MKPYISPRYVVIAIRIALALALPLALAALVTTLTGCSYANQQAGEIDAGPLFPKIIFDTNIELGKKHE